MDLVFLNFPSSGFRGDSTVGVSRGVGLSLLSGAMAEVDALVEAGGGTSPKHRDVHQAKARL